MIIARPAAALVAVLATLVMSVTLSAQDGDPNPIVDYQGQRFVITRFVEGTEWLAFDALNRHVAAMDIVDPCGDEQLDNHQGAGTAWDPVTHRYWYVAPEGEVGTYVGGNPGDGAADIDTVFVLPDTVTVDGIGSLAVVSPRGIAADETHLYVVTAGPDPGDADSGGWFKFTKDGTPVSHSGGTDFNANLVEDPDAIVDGITWVPPESPWAAGLFLVALEHSGIQIIDADGYFVARLQWTDEGLEFGDQIVPTAFAGISIDPLTGDVFLTDNDTSTVQRWIRLAVDAPTAGYVVSNGWEQAWVNLPAPEGCNFPLWRDYVGAFQENPLLFGLAYRHADGRIYAFDFNTAELFSFDPRRGDVELVAQTDLANVWGLAYDPVADRLFASAEEDLVNRIWIVDPEDGSATALPFTTNHYVSDIAYDPSGGWIYGVTFVAGDWRLVRISPTDGQGLVVGDPTMPASGLTWDPRSGNLIAKSSDDALWSIDPATGVAVLLLENAGGSWEGLALVDEEDPATPVDEPPVRALTPFTIAVMPNPFAARTRFSFDLPRAGPVVAEIFDLRGRRVRAFDLGLRADGPLTLAWDGRNEDGRHVGSGVYFLRVQTTSGHASARLVRIH